ncbi:hypothetical protein ACFQ6E_07735 [Streptomyces sp. NPDC056462]|uniref:hypothetical protein n=1 Tax=Streptomyces sp. NPDC056462 TaxID=3345826 RepID=UPI00369FE6AF
MLSRAVPSTQRTTHTAALSAAAGLLGVTDSMVRMLRVASSGTAVSLLYKLRDLLGGAGRLGLKGVFWGRSLLKALDDQLKICQRSKTKFLIMDIDRVHGICERGIFKPLCLAQDPGWQENPIPPAPVESPFDLSRQLFYDFLYELRNPFLR